MESIPASQVSLCIHTIHISLTSLFVEEPSSLWLTPALSLEEPFYNRLSVPGCYTSLSLKMELRFLLVSSSRVMFFGLLFAKE